MSIYSLCCIYQHVHCLYHNRAVLKGIRLQNTKIIKIQKKEQIIDQLAPSRATSRKCTNCQPSTIGVNSKVQLCSEILSYFTSRILQLLSDIWSNTLSSASLWKAKVKHADTVIISIVRQVWQVVLWTSYATVFRMP